MSAPCPNCGSISASVADDAACDTCGFVRAAPGVRSPSAASPRVADETIDSDPHLTQPIDSATGDSSATEISRPSRLPSGSAVAGRRIGKYELIKRLGGGSFGAVFKARDTELQRLVAIKIPHSQELSGPLEAARYLEEARNVARLKHPGIVPLHDAGRLGDLPYLVSEFVDGVTLADRIATARPALRQAATWIADLADALDYAHREGVVHRDVKPANVMIDAADRPRLMDFGVAKRDTAEATISGEGSLLGTPAYMSPEQAAGRARSADGRTDVYSLGVMLYEMLAGDRPFRGAAGVLIQQILHDEPRSPRALNKRIPRDLETVCLKCLAKEPDRRYRTAGDLAEDLRRWLRDEPVTARPVGRVERSWRWCRRNPGVASLAAAIAILLTGVAIASLLAATSFRSIADAESVAKRKAQDSESKEQIARREADLRRDEMRSRLSREYVAAGGRALDDGDFTLALLHFAKAFELDAGDPTREPAHRLRLAMTWRQLPRLAAVFSHDLPITDIAATTDHSRFATSSYDRTARLWSADGTPGPVLRHDLTVNGVAFSPDGKLVATCGNDHTVRLWNAATGEPVGPPWIMATQVRQVGFSPDGRLIAAVCGRHDALYSLPPGAPRDPVFDVDRSLPAAMLIELTTSRVIPIESRSNNPWCFEFSADSRRIAVGGPDSEAARVCDTTTGKEITAPIKPAGTPSLLVNLRLSPDGRRLTTSDYNGAHRLWDVDSGRLITDLVSGRGNVHAFSADGKILIDAGLLRSAADGTPTANQARASTGILAIEPGISEHRVLTFTQGIVRPRALGGADLGGAVPRHDMAVRPIILGGGRWVVSAISMHEAALWDYTGVASGDVITEPSASWSDAALSPDGRLLAMANYARGLDLRSTSDASLVRSIRSRVRANAVAYHPSEPVVAIGDTQGSIRRWNIDTGREVPPRLMHKQQVVETKFDATGRFLVTLAGSGIGDAAKLTVWDVAAGREAWSTVDRAGARLYMTINPAGTLVAFGSAQSEVMVYDIATGKSVISDTTSHTYWVRSPEFSPDGKLLAACGGDSLLSVFSLPERRRIANLSMPGPVQRARFSPDGKRLAVVCSDGTLEMFETAGFRRVLPPSRHVDDPTYVAWSLDGRWLVVMFRGGSWTMIDAATAEPLMPKRYSANSASGVWHVSPDRLLFGRVRGVELMDLTPAAGSPAEWLELATLVSGRRVDDAGRVSPASPGQAARSFASVRGRPIDPLAFNVQQRRNWRHTHAYRLTRAGHTDDLRHWVDNAVAEDPDHAEMRAVRLATPAAAVPEQQILDDTLAVAERVNPSYWAFVPFAAEPAGKLSEAIDRMNRAIAATPDSAELLAARGAAHGLMENYAGAIADFDRAEKLGLDPAYLWDNRGRAHAILGQWSAAAVDLARASEFEPDSVIVACYHALVSGMAGDAEMFNRLTGKGGLATRFKDVTSFADKLRLARTIGVSAAGDHDAALALARSALTAARTDAERRAVQQTLALLLLRKKNDRQSKDALAVAMAGLPTSEDPTTFVIAALIEASNNHPDAERALDVARKAFELADAARPRKLWWDQVATYQMLKGEAEKLIASSARP